MSGITKHKLTAPGFKGAIVYSFKEETLVGIYIDADFSEVAHQWVFASAPKNKKDIGRLPVEGKLIEEI